MIRALALSEGPDACDEGVAAGGQRQIVGFVEPVVGVAPLGAAAQKGSVEPEVVALVGTDVQADGGGGAKLEMPAVGGDERRGAGVGVGDPLGGPGVSGPEALALVVVGEGVVRDRDAHGGGV